MGSKRNSIQCQQDCHEIWQDMRQRLQLSQMKLHGNLWSILLNSDCACSKPVESLSYDPLSEPWQAVASALGVARHEVLYSEKTGRVVHIQQLPSYMPQTKPQPLLVRAAPCHVLALPLSSRAVRGLPITSSCKQSQPASVAHISELSTNVNIDLVLLHLARQAVQGGKPHKQLYVVTAAACVLQAEHKCAACRSLL